VLGDSLRVIQTTGFLDMAEESQYRKVVELPEYISDMQRLAIPESEYAEQVSSTLLPRRQSKHVKSHKQVINKQAIE